MANTHMPDSLSTRTGVSPSVLSELNRALRVEGRRAGWPSTTLRNMKVVFEDGDLKVAYPASEDVAVKDLEYGASNTSPKPLLRTWSTSANTKAQTSIVESVIGMFV